MHLHFEPTPAQLSAAALAKDEVLRYASPCDLDQKGGYADGFALFTDRRFLLLIGDRIAVAFDWADCLALKCEVYVGCGALVADTGEGKRLLCRFSLRHADRFCEIAGLVNETLSPAHPPAVPSTAREQYCVKCGAPLVGGTCAACSGRRVSLERFLDLCKPYILPLTAISALMLVVSFCTLYSQQVVKVVLRDFLKDATGEFAGLIPYLLLMAGLAAVIIAAGAAKKVLCVRLGARMSMGLRQKVFDKLQTLSMSYIGRGKAGELMNRITSDTVAVRDFMDHCFGNLMSNLVTMVGAVVLMFVLNAKLAILAVVFVPAVLLFSRVFNRKVFRLFRAQAHKNDKIKSRLQDVISGIRVVKSFGRESREAERFNEYSRELAETNSRNETFWAIFFPLLTLAMGLGIHFVQYFGGVDVLNGVMPVEELVQFTAYASLIYAPLRWMAGLPRMILRMLNAMDRIYGVLDEEPEIADRPDAVRHEIAGDVVFDDVSFAYTSYEPVLQNISFTVRRGEKIGLVGASGVGKSSLINLLMRLWDVNGGRILIDGIDVRDYDAADLHRQIGVVLQENFLFSGTVLDNIRYACPGADMEQVIRAAKTANAHDFICLLPDGYNTYIGEKGHKLSGGERQRIAIARAVLSDPRLLILDEATSSLDTESEELVQQAMERLTGGRTTFAIAHRLSTLRNADRIVVLADHRVAEIGTHEELMKKKGVYYGLITAQSKLHRLPKAQN